MKDRALLIISGVIAFAISIYFFKVTGEYSSVFLWATASLFFYDIGIKNNGVLAKKLAFLPVCGFTATSSASIFNGRIGDLASTILLVIGFVCLYVYYFLVKTKK